MNWEAADIFYRNRMQSLQYQQFNFNPQPALGGFNFHLPSPLPRNHLTPLRNPFLDYGHQQKPTNYYQLNGNFRGMSRGSAQDGLLDSPPLKSAKIPSLFEATKDFNFGTRDLTKSGCTTNSIQMCTAQSKNDQGKHPANAIIEKGKLEPDGAKRTLPTATFVGKQTLDLKIDNDKRKTLSVVHVETQTDLSETDYFQKILATVSTQTEIAMRTVECSSSTDLCSNCRRTLDKPNSLSPITPACHEEGLYKGQRGKEFYSAEEAKHEAWYVKEFQLPSIKNLDSDRHRTCETYSPPTIDESEEGNIGQLLKSLQALTIPKKYNGLLCEDKGEERDESFPFQNSSTSKSDLREQEDSNPVAFETKKFSSLNDKSPGHVDRDAESLATNSSQISIQKKKRGSQRTANNMPSLASQNPSLKAKGLPPPLKFGGKRIFKHIEDVEQAANRSPISQASCMTTRSNTHVSRSQTEDETEGSISSFTAISKPIVSHKIERGDTTPTGFNPCKDTSCDIPFVKKKAQQSISHSSLSSTDTDIHLQRVFTSVKTTSSRETVFVNYSKEIVKKGPRPRSSKPKAPLKFSTKKGKKERIEAESSPDPSKWQQVATSIKRLKTDPASQRLKTYCSQEMNAHLRRTIQERHPLLTKREVENVLDMVISETTYLDGMQPSQILKGVDLIVERLDIDVSERKAEKERWKLCRSKKDGMKDFGESSEDEENSEAVWSQFSSANPYTTLDMIENRSVRRQD